MKTSKSGPSAKRKSRKLSWKETYLAMAQAKEDWSDFDGTMADGLDDELTLEITAPAPVG